MRASSWVDSCGIQPASTSTPAHQSSRAPDEDLGARRATLTLTPPSAGFQVPPLAWGGPARIASESSETSFLICGTSKWPACDDRP